MSQIKAKRSAEIKRETNETKIKLRIDIDGSGDYAIDTKIGFFDHMLDQLAKHSLINMTIKTEGDRHIDDHHSVEDTGIALGQALKQALGDKRGILRYGECALPMDETLTKVALDVSGRPFLVWNVTFPADKIGTFDTELIREFFQAFAMNAGITLHIENCYGDNAHHIAESIFKAVAKALRFACEHDPRTNALPSTKGML